MNVTSERIGHYTSLFRIEPRLLDPLAAMALHAAETGVWRLVAPAGGDDALQQALWGGVHRQRAIMSRDGAEVLGLCQLFNVDFSSRRAELSVLLKEDHWEQGWPIEGLALFITEVFEELPIRKIFAEVNPEVRAKLASGIGRLIREEGRLKDRIYASGRYVDQILLSVSREQWPFLHQGPQR